MWVQTTMNANGMTRQWADALRQGPPGASTRRRRQRDDARFLIWLIHDYWQDLFSSTAIASAREYQADGSLGLSVSALTLKRLNEERPSHGGARRTAGGGGSVNKSKHSERITTDAAIEALGTLSQVMIAIGGDAEAEYIARPLRSLETKRAAMKARRTRPKLNAVPVGTRTIGVHWNEPVESAPGWWWVVALDDDHNLFVQREWTTARVLEYLRKQSGPFLAGLAFCFSAPRKYMLDRWAGDPAMLWHECAKLMADQDLAPFPDDLLEDVVRDLGSPFFAPQHGDPHPGLPEKEMLRRTERDVRARTGAVPRSIFEVGSRGTVGALALNGMPLLAALRSDRIAIWPFDQPRPTCGTCVEIFPRSVWAATFPGTDPALKGDREVRAAFLADKTNGLTGISAEHREDFVTQHRAFDALLTAWALRRFGRDLPVPRDAKTASIEGEIWLPAPGIS